MITAKIKPETLRELSDLIAGIRSNLKMTEPTVDELVAEFMGDVARGARLCTVDELTPLLMRAWVSGHNSAVSAID